MDVADPERAARVLGAASVLRESDDARMAFDEEPEYADRLRRLRASLGAAAFDGAWVAGRALSRREAIDLALAVTLPAVPKVNA